MYTCAEVWPQCQICPKSNDLLGNIVFLTWIIDFNHVEIVEICFFLWEFLIYWVKKATKNDKKMHRGRRNWTGAILAEGYQYSSPCGFLAPGTFSTRVKKGFISTIPGTRNLSHHFTHSMMDSNALNWMSMRNTNNSSQCVCFEWLGPPLMKMQQSMVKNCSIYASNNHSIELSIEESEEIKKKMLF